LFWRTNFSANGAQGYSQERLQTPVPHNAYQQNLYNPPPNRQNNYRFENQNTRQNQYGARMVYRNPENLPMGNAIFLSQRHLQLTPAPGTGARNPNYRINTWQNRQTNVNQLA
jgi:hypothetical protein